MCCDRRLGFEKPAIRLEDSDVVLRHPESRKAPHQFRRQEHLVPQVVKAGRGECSPHQGTGGRPDLGYTRHMEQPPADCRFEFAPQRVGAPQQGDVGGVLEISQPDDAR
jgi:hypothetical protein